MGTKTGLMDTRVNAEGCVCTLCLGRYLLNMWHGMLSAGSLNPQKPESPFHRNMWNSNILCLVLNKMEAGFPTCYGSRRLFHWWLLLSLQAERQDLLVLTLMNEPGEIFFSFYQETYVEAHIRKSLWHTMKFPMYLFSKHYRFGRLFFEFQLIFSKCKIQTVIFPWTWFRREPPKNNNFKKSVMTETLLWAMLPLKCYMF